MTVSHGSAKDTQDPLSKDLRTAIDRSPRKTLLCVCPNALVSTTSRYRWSQKGNGRKRNYLHVRILKSQVVNGVKYRV